MIKNDNFFVFNIEIKEILNSILCKDILILIVKII